MILDGGIILNPVVGNRVRQVDSVFLLVVVCEPADLKDARRRHDPAGGQERTDGLRLHWRQDCNR